MVAGSSSLSRTTGECLMKLRGLTPVTSLISSAESAEATHPPSLFELRRVRPSLLRRSCRFGCEGRAPSSPGSRPGLFAKADNLSDPYFPRRVNPFLDPYSIESTAESAPFRIRWECGKCLFAQTSDIGFWQWSGIQESVLPGE